MVAGALGAGGIGASGAKHPQVLSPQQVGGGIDRSSADDDGAADEHFSEGEQQPSSSADAAAEQASVTTATLAKRQGVKDRNAERVLFNMNGKELHDKLVQDLLTGGLPMPTGMFTGVVLGTESERHEIEFELVPKAATAPSYPCATENLLVWVIQNDDADYYTNGVTLCFPSIMDNHAIILLDPRKNLWWISPFSDDDGCIVWVGDNQLRFGQREAIQDGTQIKVGKVEMKFLIKSVKIES
jgi:hypothetical protein